ncbi:hypothetical protein B0H13DRAFT_1941374 [Mycena leptocephala]|nr:hypothetical protein B0H13DRAFT_1941374 [Mycena leptocephala]
MHPAVQMRTLERLPLSIKQIAQRACRKNRSFEDLERTRDAFTTMPPAQRLWSLPVFFDNLNFFQPKIKDNVKRAVLALDVIFHSRAPPEAGISLWSRVWPWFYFIHTHRDQLPGVDLFPERRFYINFILFAGAFHDDGPSYTIMSATAGFKVMIAKAWSFLHHLEEPNLLEVALNDIYGFIVDSNFGDPASLSELIEGAGGTLDDLAGLVVNYIQTVVGRNAPWPVSRSNAEYIAGICLFLKDADPPPEGDTQWSLPPLGPLHKKLLHHGLVHTVVVAMLSLSTNPQTDSVPDECLMLLERILLASPGYLWLEEALDAGLIQVIIGCAISHTRTEQTTAHLCFLIDLVLPAALVSYYVLRQLKWSSAGVQELVSREEFQTSGIYNHWTSFMSLADERLGLLAEFDSLEFVSPKACDNLSCGKIKRKRAFSRCSGCKAMYYCDSACQAVDWRDGGHRNFCHSYRSLCLTELAQPKLLVRERSFLRALIHEDYIKHLSHICTQQITFIADNPTCELFITVFNYCEAALRIEVHSAMDSPLAATLQKAGPEWAALVSRAQRSERRLHLHVMRVPRGLHAQHWVVPLRTSNSTFYRAIQVLATEPGDGVAEKIIMDDIDSLLAHDLDAPGVH